MAMTERHYFDRANIDTGTRVSVPAGSLAVLLDMGDAYLRLLKLHGRGDTLEARQLEAALLAVRNCREKVG